MNPLPLILASASPRRAELLRHLHLCFRVIHSEAEELSHEQFTAGELAQLNAYRKARAVAKRFPDALVLGADTMVFLNGRHYGKPIDLPHARSMLGELQGLTHQVVTGVCLMHLRQHRHSVFAEVTDVHFKRLTSEQIDRYLTSINPFDKAGAYAIQDGGDALVQDIAGSYSNVVGLPLERLKSELAAWPALATA